MAISAAGNDRSWRIFGPIPAVGFHGGIDRSAATAAMSDVRFRACSYSQPANGPTWPFRWQLWQRF